MTSKVSPLIEACRKNYPSLPTPTANRASPKFGRSDQSQSLICSQIFRESPPYQVPIAPEHPDDDSSFARLPRSTTHRPRPSTSTPTNRSSPPSFATVEPENLSHNHAGRHEITPAGRSPRRAHFPHLVTPHGRRCTSPSQEALRSLPLRTLRLPPRHRPHRQRRLHLPRRRVQDRKRPAHRGHLHPPSIRHPSHQLRPEPRAKGTGEEELEIPNLQGRRNPRKDVARGAPRSVLECPTFHS